MRKLIAIVSLAVAAGPAFAAAATNDANRPEAAGDKRDRMICKSFPTVGSLIASHKVCKTKYEWDRERGSPIQNAPGSCAGAGGDGGGFCAH